LAAISGLFWNALQTARARLAIPLKQALSSVYAIRASDGAILWRYLLYNGGASWAGWLAVGNGIVYVSDFAVTNDGTGDGYSDIYALQSSTGEATWHDRIQANSSNALLANGVLYLVGSYNNSSSSVTCALRAGDGAYLWKYSMSGYVYNAPVQSGTTLYIAGANGIVYALHTDNGAILWHYQTDVGI
jgi:outer membrane protein assembly factor BamB